MKLVVIAGPNGSGKSTLLWKLKGTPGFPDLYICPDEIVTQYNHITDINVRYVAAMNCAEEYRILAMG